MPGCDTPGIIFVIMRNNYYFPDNNYIPMINPDSKLANYRSKRVVTPVFCRTPMSDHERKTWTSKDGTTDFIYLLQDTHLINICKILHDIIDTYNQTFSNYTSKAIAERCLNEAIVAAVAIRYVGHELYLRSIITVDLNTQLEGISGCIDESDYKYPGFVHCDNGSITFRK
jgi:hypothetical protein